MAQNSQYRKKTGQKRKKLGIDKVGYRSLHFIAELDDTRKKLPEYSKIKNQHFEIQLTTVLSHTWSEFQHDRNYKFSGVLPKELERRMNLHAGTLENIDKDFNTIALDLEKYSKEVTEKTKKGELDLPIDSTSLLQYLDKKFENYNNVFRSKIGRTQIQVKDIIDELNSMGIKSLKDLDRIIPDNIGVLYQKHVKTPRRYSGLLRICMIYHDPEKYFKTAFKHHFNYLTPLTTKVLKDLGFNIDIARKYVSVVDV